ncbi:MAG: hypothetical protein UHK60_11905, partial [Acutalibacteraceae bacterium]|nr:hypothetical protein [Acutalibacteraceae bacterium]
MDFNETIKKVNFFYADYDKTMANVDNYFDIIDTNAGQESSNELKIIIDILKNFWNKYSNNESVNQELIVDEELSSFSNKLGEPFENETVIFDLCKKIQAYFRNYTAVDTKPIIHCESDDVINRLFEHIENNEFHNKDLQFTITRIIYELVSDDLLIRCGISKLHKWNYGTDAYSLLSSEQQLVILLNQSIMIDRLHSGQHLLKLYLKRLNKQIDGFHYLDWFVYYVAGFLNFKIHNYRESKKYFERVEKESKLHNSTYQTKKRYFHAVLLIAYGHEYAGEFAQAIEKIVMPVNDLLALLNSIEVINIKQTSVLLTVLNNLVTKAYKDTLFSKFFSGTTITEHISDTDEQDQRDIHIEILHALAHCINEYAIQNYNTKAEDCAKLIRFARALMAFIAKEVKEYWKASVVTPFFMILEVAMEMLIPLLMASIIDKGVEVGNMTHIYEVGVVMIVVATIGLLSGMAGGRFAAKASTG